MVVWVFAGGGETEVRALIPFLQKHFPGCSFERKTPVRRKPGPKPNVSYGKTGQSLIEQIKEELPIALQYEPNRCELIFVFDDLDCRDATQQRGKILQELNQIPGCANLNKLVGFSAPEPEAWIIADWDNSMARHSDFRGSHEAIRHWLSRQGEVDFQAPESFSEYDSSKNSCKKKLSEAIKLSVVQKGNPSKQRFSKKIHTPILLLMIDVEQVREKCPQFREMYNFLQNFCRVF